MDAQPATETVYLQNLNEKVALEDLRNAIRDACGTAAVLDIKAKRALAMRGQAFVICASQQDAQTAIAALNGRRLFGKSVVVAPARFRSDHHVLTDGTHAAEVERRRNERASRPPRVTRRQKLEALATRAAMAAQGASYSSGPAHSRDGRGRTSRPQAARLPAALAAPAPPGTSRTLFVSGMRPGVPSDALARLQ